MKISKLLAGLALVALASCDNLVPDDPIVDNTPPSDPIDKAEPVDPAPSLKLLVFGLPADTASFSDRGAEIIKAIQGGKDFRLGDSEFKNIGTGFMAPLARSLRQGGFGVALDKGKFLAQESSKNCADVKAKKIAYHLEQDSELPPGFGKITKMEMDEYATKNGELWAGFIELCSWIKNGDTYDEYFWRIKLSRDDDAVTTTRTLNRGSETEPYPNTLDMSEFDQAQRDAMIQEMNLWPHKLHGKNDAVSIASVVRNGVLLNRADEGDIYTNDENCFDLFVDATQLAKLRADRTLDLDDQFNYCLGRCDGLWMNTR